MMPPHPDDKVFRSDTDLTERLRDFFLCPLCYQDKDYPRDYMCAKCWETLDLSGYGYEEVCEVIGQIIRPPMTWAYSEDALHG